MADSSVNFWVNPFQMLRLNGKDEQFTKGAEGVVDDERDNGDNTIRTRPQTSGSYTKKSSPPTSTPTRIRRHSFISPDEKPPKGMNYTMPLPPTKVVTPADAAAMLDSLTLSNYLNHDNKKFNYHQHHPHKYSVDEKQSKKQLKRSISFNHSNRSTSPRQAAIDVAEVLATTVSFVRENNKKLDRLSDEVRSDGQSSDNDMDSVMSDDSTDSWPQLNDNREIENEIAGLGAQLNNMEQKYKEQIRGKNKLIEQFEIELKRSEKVAKKKSQTIDRLESQLEASKRAIAEIIEQQQHDNENLSPDSEQVETQRLLEQELEDKDRKIEELNKKIQSLTKRAIEFKEKDEKFESISNQLLKYQSLENEWNEKQIKFDSLTFQLEVLKKREVELNEKDALIETLNIRLDTSQKVIAELREKHAPHDLLRQLRQKDYIIDDLTRQVENIDANNKDKDDDISNLKTRLNEERKHVDKLKEQTAQIEPLKKKIEEAEDANYDLRSQFSQKERQLVDLEKKYKEASKNSQDSQDKIRAQEQNISALRQEIAQIGQTLLVQNTETREKDRILTTLRDETSRMRSNYQGLINALSEKDQKIQQLESLQNAPKNDPKENEVKTSKSEVRLNALQKVLNNKIESCREYEKKIVNLEKEFEEFKKQFDESQTSSSEKEIKIARLVKMNRQLKEEVTELKQKMEEKEKELVTIKSKIPKPNPGKAPSVTSRTSKTSRRTSDSPRVVSLTRTKSSTSTSSVEEKRSSIISDSSRVSLTRTKSTASISSLEERRSSIIVPKREVKPIKPRIPSSVNTIDVLKKNITPKKESSPINRSAVTQRKREMEVVNHMLSGVASSGKNRLQKRSTTLNEAARKKSTDMVSSDSEHDIKKAPSKKRLSDLGTIMEKNRKNDDDNSTAKNLIRPKVNRPTVDTKASTSAQKTRTPLIRPLPSKKS